MPWSFFDLYLLPCLWHSWSCFFCFCSVFEFCLLPFLCLTVCPSLTSEPPFSYPFAQCQPWTIWMHNPGFYKYTLILVCTACEQHVASVLPQAVLGFKLMTFWPLGQLPNHQLPLRRVFFICALLWLLFACVLAFISLCCGSGQTWTERFQGTFEFGIKALSCSLQLISMGNNLQETCWLKTHL